MSSFSFHPRQTRLWGMVIVILATILALLGSWRLPSLHFLAQDRLLRARGSQPLPEEVVIVAIDEASLKRFGRFPWSRQIMAQALDRVATTQPKAITLSILYSDPTNEADDAALAAAIQRAGNVVVAAQLVETPDAGAEWVRPLPVIAEAAAGLGHGNVQTDYDGVARELVLRATDDAGQSFWALAVETVRVGQRTPRHEVRELPEAIKLGAQMIPVTYRAPTLRWEVADSSSAEVVRAACLTIDYRGPTGTFAANTYSLADLLDGKVAPEKLRDKYVLIGATAAALGDRIASPFTRYETADGNQHGTLMPGVEVLANAVTTILQRRFYQPASDWLAVLMAALVAMITFIGLRLAQGRGEWLRQPGVVLLLGGLILFASYFAFTHWLIVLPVVPMLFALVIATPLTLLHRALSASVHLDQRIGELMQQSLRLAPFRLTTERLTSFRLSLPRSLEAKATALSELQARLLERTRFIDRALQSVEDGLLMTDVKGIIAYANPRAADIFNTPEQYLPGSNLFARLAAAESGQLAPDEAQLAQLQKAMLCRLLEEGASIEREFTVAAPPPRHYILRMAAIRQSDEAPVGIVVTLSDITQQRELQQMQTDVMLLVTHEMKTPLTAIQGMSEVLLKFDPPAEKRREMHEAIQEATQRLRRMIDEYLDLTRLESGARPLKMDYLRLDNLIEKNLLLLDPVAQQKHITITRRFAADVPPLRADADLLTRAVTNLVSNAIKYSPENTEVLVTTKREGDVILLAVKDQGYGIPPDFRTRVFDKFFRVPRIEDADTPGTGLGLALVREIAELHQGQVRVESLTGSGSTFTLRLPLEPTPTRGE